MLVFFEHLITIDLEIDLFWKRGFSGAAALFLTNRYLITIYSAFGLTAVFDQSVTNPEVSLTDSSSGDSMWA